MASDAVDSGLGSGIAHNEAILEYLARLDVVGHGSLRQVLDTLSRANQGGILIAILGRATPAELDTLARLRRSFQLVVAIVSEPPDPRARRRCRPASPASTTPATAPSPSRGAPWSDPSARRSWRESGDEEEARRWAWATAPATPRRRPRSPSWRCRWRRRSGSAACSSAGRGCPPLALAAVASHLLAIFCRRRGLGLTLSSIASLVGLALFTSLAFYRDSQRLRPARRARTWHVMTDDLATSWHDFGTAIALVEPRTGFLVAAVVAIWLSRVPGRRLRLPRRRRARDARRPGHPVRVLLRPRPASGLRLLSAALWLGCAAITYVLHRSMLQEDGSGWLTTPPTRHHRRRRARRRQPRAQRHRDRPDRRARCCRAPATTR